jgi:hypothetical protein
MDPGPGDLAHGPGPSSDPQSPFPTDTLPCDADGALQARIGGASGHVSRIRILLVGVTGMLNEILRSAISSEPDMAIVDYVIKREDELGTYTRRRRIDVIIFGAGNDNFSDDAIVRLLQANPRLSLLSIDGTRDQGTLHHLVLAHDAIGRLAQSSLTDAIRAGAALRAC